MVFFSQLLVSDSKEKAQMRELIKVMLVEDDPYTCEDFAYQMRGFSGLELVCQTDSETIALEYLKTNPVDVVILDLELREGDGLSFLEKLKGLEKEKPFIFVVTNTVSEITLNMVRANGSDYIYQKTNLSFSTGKILSLIEKVFLYKRARRSMDEEQTAEYLTQQENDRMTRQFISRQLNKIGFSNGKLGTNYIQEILERVVSEGKPLNNSYMSQLYEEIAKEHHTGAVNVERNIRSAIASTWKNTQSATLERFYPYPWDKKKGKPTNREFLVNMADRLTTK